MLPLPPFSWLAPRSLDEALDALAAAPDETVLLAGGTDVLPHLKYGRRAPRRVIGLGRLPELARVEPTADGGLWVGAGVTLDHLAAEPRVVARYPALAAAAAAVGSPQLRRMGTLGGNLCLDTRCRYFDQSAFWRGALGHCLKKDGDTCHVVPGGRRCVAALAADTPAPLLVYEATIELRSVRAVRRLALTDFYAGDGLRPHVAARDEVVTGVHLPAPAADLRSAHVKVRARAAIDFPLLAVAAAVGGGEARVAVTALGPRPRLLRAPAPPGPLPDATIDALIALARARCHPLASLGDEAWRAAQIAPSVRRALTSLQPSRETP
ncbi:MAG: FAD binding domain-containing protein [Kofleriaceae bacterium]|nr:FAD binding domain-containing protein [Kofleriaceae bacterium]MCL4222980.1 FAD binding domain-containing protein [Myxococcales bacterium]